MSQTEVLGVSHLVVGVRDMASTEAFLRRYGHSTHGEVQAAPNPDGKRAFVVGGLAETFTMKLMVSSTGSVPIELLYEDSGGGPGVAATGLEAVLGPPVDLGAKAVLEAVGRDDTVASLGFRAVASCPPVAGVVALLVYCRDLTSALSLWHTLGLRHRAVGANIAEIIIRGIRSSNRLAVYVLADRTRSSPGYLNRAGIVCLSLLCRQPDRLRAALHRQGYVVSECFTIAPFGQRLRIFFTRNTSGEIYEFLSVEGEALGGRS